MGSRIHKLLLSLSPSPCVCASVFMLSFHTQKAGSSELLRLTNKTPQKKTTPCVFPHALHLYLAIPRLKPTSPTLHFTMFAASRRLVMATRCQETQRHEPRTHPGANKYNTGIEISLMDSRDSTWLAAGAQAAAGARAVVTRRRKQTN